MNDIIYRKDAIDAVRKCLVKEVTPAYRLIDKAEVMTELMMLPFAESRKGKWIYGESEEGNDGYFCDQYGNFVPWIYKEFDIDFMKEFHFCPNCGAKMEEY